MGVQSLDNKVLYNLNRAHLVDDALKSIKILQESDFIDNYGIDLIQGLPEQDLQSIKNDFDAISKNNIQSSPYFCLYALVERRIHLFFKNYFKEYYSNQKQEAIAEMFIYTHKYLTKEAMIIMKSLTTVKTESIQYIIKLIGMEFLNFMDLEILQLHIF